MALIPRPTLVAFGHARTSLNVDADFMLNSYAFGVELRQCLRINGTVRGGIRTPESLPLPPAIWFAISSQRYWGVPLSPR